MDEYPRLATDHTVHVLFLTQHKLTKAQKATVERFMDIASGSTEDEAVQALKESDWRLEFALELHFQRSRSKRSNAPNNAASIDAMFDKYKVKDQGVNERIEAEGIIRLCQDLSLDPMDPVTLVFSSKMNAATMGQYTKEEFHKGMRVMGTDTIDKLKAKLPALRSELESTSGFKNVYEFSFQFAKEPNAKALALDTAIAMWKVLLTDKWSFTDDWCEFLQEKHGKAISNDTWSQVLEFKTQVGSNLKSYNANDAWPYLIDEFVEMKLGK